jgi:hypothetical protein
MGLEGIVSKRIGSRYRSAGEGASMATDAEIEAAVVAMRAVRVKGAKVHEEVMRAYARAAVEAAERARKEDFQRRAQLNNKPTAPTAEGARS